MKRNAAKLMQACVEKKLKLYDLLRGFFGNDNFKVATWLGTPNPLLGNISPNEMINKGRIDKLIKFVETSLGENKR